MNCCRTDIPDNKNATWEQIINKTAPEYVPEPIESEIDELIEKTLNKNFVILIHIYRMINLILYIIIKLQ